MKSPTRLLLAVAGSAHLAACADITFPVVAMGTAGADSNQFTDLHASIITVQNDITTYSVGCSTTRCAGWDNLPTNTIPITVAIGPSTIDVKFADLPFLSSHSACTFQGSPPTAASCEITNSVGGRTRTIGNEAHFTIPAAPTDSGNWDLYNIMSATLKVIDGSGNTTDTASASTTTPTAGSAASSTALGSGSGSTSAGFARETGVPAAKWVVGMGVAVGAMVAA